MSAILYSLEAATCVAIWEYQANTVQIYSEPPNHKIKNKLVQTQKKWLDDKERLLDESRAIFKRETYLIERLQLREDRMAKGDIDAAGPDPSSTARHLYELQFKIRQNWRELADLLDRYCD
ncbi:uncharacterized protein N7518_004846 [Penicillium psychrosexuale]|uniref:uncharacterized protein n=1 Tax=Penicillium psychrosexuale TaxID=1002107 RepID=UPI00254530DF|nr:uncharacterized protein N7518_004846 [Penicillium psychrosexuale]KAJ5796306.1 hypothetical protein N7518_004846 [Penicillium psychrosexuale]